MFFEFTQDGRWFIRNDKGAFATKMFDTHQELVEFYLNNF